MSAPRTTTDYYGETHTIPGPWHTVEQIKRANEAAGNHFFSAAAMKSFGSRIAPGVIGGRLIVTGEQDRSPFVAPENRPWGGARRYTVRLVDDTGRVQPMCPEDAEDDFGAFPTLSSARRWAQLVIAGERSSARASWLDR